MLLPEMELSRPRVLHGASRVDIASRVVSDSEVYLKARNSKENRARESRASPPRETKSPVCIPRLLSE